MGRCRISIGTCCASVTQWAVVFAMHGSVDMEFLGGLVRVCQPRKLGFKNPRKQGWEGIAWCAILVSKINNNHLHHVFVVNLYL